MVEEIRDTKEEPVQDETTPVIEEITSEETTRKDTKETKDTIKEVIEAVKETGEDIPEGIQKLMNFMTETLPKFPVLIDMSTNEESYQSLLANRFDWHI